MSKLLQLFDRKHKTNSRSVCSTFAQIFHLRPKVLIAEWRLHSHCDDRLSHEQSMKSTNWTSVEVFQRRLLMRTTRSRYKLGRKHVPRPWGVVSLSYSNEVPLSNVSIPLEDVGVRCYLGRHSLRCRIVERSSCLCREKHTVFRFMLLFTVTLRKYEKE